MKSGKYEQALTKIDELLRETPNDASLREIRRQVAALATPAAGGGAPGQPQPPALLSGEDRLNLDSLRLAAEDFQRAGDPQKQVELAEEILRLSAPLAAKRPDVSQVWSYRAAAALHLDRSKEGWEAGRKLVGLGALQSGDEPLRRVLAQLNRRGWLAERYETVEQARREQTAAAERRTQEAADQRSRAERAARRADALQKYGHIIGTWQLDIFIRNTDAKQDYQPEGGLVVDVNEEGQLTLSGTARSTLVDTLNYIGPDMRRKTDQFRYHATVQVTSFDAVAARATGVLVSEAQYADNGRWREQVHGNERTEQFSLKVTENGPGGLVLVARENTIKLRKIK